MSSKLTPSVVRCTVKKEFPFSVAVVQSVIPISAALIVVAQALMFPDAMDEALRGDIVKAEEVV